MAESMKWHCLACHADFQGPTDRTPAGGCAHCGSRQIFDLNVEFLGEIVPYPFVTSHRKCEACGEEMRRHGYLEALGMAICPVPQVGK